MDLFVLIIDILVILLFIGLIALVSPYLMRFLKKYTTDRFVQLIPVFAFIFIGSILISMGYGGFQETLFFKISSILSFVLLASVLILTLMVKKFWKEHYDHLLLRMNSFHKKKELKLSKATY